MVLTRARRVREKETRARVCDAHSIARFAERVAAVRATVASGAMEPPPPRPRPAPAPSVPRQADASASAAPTRRVLNQSHLGQWQASCARADLLGFVRSLSEAVRGMSLSAPVHVSPAVSAAVAVLDDLEVSALCAVCCCVHGCPC